jgi:hypothetical protein
MNAAGGDVSVGVATSAPRDTNDTSTVAPVGGGPAADLPPPSASRDERMARMRAGLADLQRWLEDRLRTGLSDPALARYATWDNLAARLVDAQVGALANRVRRMAGIVDARPGWHSDLLAELGMLHLIASGGLRPPSLLAESSSGWGLVDSVAAAIGWQVRQADVLAGVPHTDDWQVMGRSDVREDRIEVRRTWLLGRSTGAWAMSLSFAAYGQALDVSLPVGSSINADLYRYPGALGLRCIVAARHGPPGFVATAAATAGTVDDALASVGRAIAVEPWLERWPLVVRANVTRAATGNGWVVSDHTGSAPLVDGPGLDVVLAASFGHPVVMTCEWSAAGLLPLTVHLPGAGSDGGDGRDGRVGQPVRHLDVGPVVDESFAGGDPRQVGR